MWMGLIQLVERPEENKLGFLKEEGILPHDCSIKCNLSFQPAGLPYGLWTCQLPPLRKTILWKKIPSILFLWRTLTDTSSIQHTFRKLLLPYLANYYTASWSVFPLCNVQEQLSSLLHVVSCSSNLNTLKRLHFYAENCHLGSPLLPNEVQHPNIYEEVPGLEFTPLTD